MRQYNPWWTGGRSRICPTGVGRRFAKSRRGCRHHLAAERFCSPERARCGQDHAVPASHPYQPRRRTTTNERSPLVVRVACRFRTTRRARRTLISPSDGNRVGSTPLLMAWLNCEFAHCPPTAGGSKSVDRWLHERVGKQPHSNFAAEFAITFKLRFAIPLILQLVCRKVRIPVGEILDVCW